MSADHNFDNLSEEQIPLKPLLEPLTEEPEKLPETGINSPEADNLRKNCQKLRIKQMKVSDKDLIGWNMEVIADCDLAVVPAVIDTAAQVSVMSIGLAKRLGFKFPVGQEVFLSTAESNGGTLKSYSWPDFEFRISGRRFKTHVCVSPISDHLLLGLNFLMKYQCNIDVQRACLFAGPTRIPVVFRKNSEDDQIMYKVKAVKRTVIQPRSTHVIKVKSRTDHLDLGNDSENVLVMSPDAFDQRLLIPNAVISVGESKLTIRNMANVPITIKKHKLIGIASLGNMASKQDLPNESVKVRRVNLVDPPVLCEELEKAHIDLIEDHEFMVVSNEFVTLETKRMPEHLRALFIKSCTHLTEDQAVDCGKLLIEYQHIFSKSDLDIGCFTGLKHTIETNETRPVTSGMRRTPVTMESEEKSCLDKMLAAGVIQPSTSPWSSAPVLIRKKGGTVRWCIDYRKLNDVTIKDTYPLPLINECLDTLSGTEFFSTLDLSSGYWQIDLDPKDRHKTAFLTKYGLYEHTRMGFGLCNAPGTFMRAMHLVLQGLTWQEVLAYLDDVIVTGKTFDLHLINLRKVFERFEQNNLKLKPKKCELFQIKVHYLGKVVSREGVAIDPKKIEVVKEWPRPASMHDIQIFMGLVNYHRDFIKDLARLACPLYKLMSKKVEFIWTDECEDSFQALKGSLATAPVLQYPDVDAPFILDVDASNDALGAELLQVKDGKEFVIGFASSRLSPAQRNYCTTRRELLALVKFTSHYRHYLLGREFTVRTDHSSLVWLMRFKSPQGQLARWLEELSQYHMRIEHRKGVLHSNADSLSRVSTSQRECDCYEAGKLLSSLPCGGCKYCTQKHRDWEKFHEDIDDVVPLAVVRTVGVSLTPNVTWLRNYQPKDLAKRQLTDPNIKKFLEWTQQTKPPDELEISLSSRDLKHYWSHRHLFRIVNDILYYYWQGETGVPGANKLLFVVPENMRKEILRYCHDDLTAGHPGRERTSELVKNSFYWRCRFSYICEYIDTCATCRACKHPTKKPRGLRQAYQAGELMSRVHMDILGPFDISSRGNEYILMIIDQFSRWVECIPLPKANAVSIAEAAVNNFFSRFGWPDEIHTDQGKPFDGHLMHALCNLMEIAKTRTTPYYPASNGEVERQNRTLLQLIRMFLRKRKRCWDKYLFILAGAMRACKNRITGFTPNMMMLGREVRVPMGVILGIADPDRYKEHPSEYVKQLEKELHDVHKIARERLGSRIRFQKKTYDVRANAVTFAVGDVAWRINYRRPVGESAKLQNPLSGPLLVTGVLSPLVFTVRDRYRVYTLHHNNLIKANCRDLPRWFTKMRAQFLTDQDAGRKFDYPIRVSAEPEAEYNFVSDLFRMNENPESASSRGGRKVDLNNLPLEVDSDSTLPFSERGMLAQLPSSAPSRLPLPVKRKYRRRKKVESKPSEPSEVIPPTLSLHGRPQVKKKDDLYRY